MRVFRKKEKGRKRNWENNKGYTLIEMIVTLLITGIIMVAIMNFIDIANSSYRAVNAEIIVQIESQTAMNRITDLIQESKEFEFYEDLFVNGKTFHTLCVRAVDSQEVLSGGTPKEYYYIIMMDGADNKLRFGKTPVPDPESEGAGTSGIDLNNKATVAQEIINQDLIGNDHAMLAKQVSRFYVKKATSKLVQITLGFHMDGKEYLSTNSVSLRNNQNKED